MDAGAGPSMVGGKSLGEVGDVDTLNEQLSRIGLGKYRLGLFELKELELAPKNARFMPSEVFGALTANIKKDGALGSMPLLVRRGDKMRVVSGNHRVRAAMSAGLTQALCFYVGDEVTRDEELAMQLSHNAIEGQDDPSVLRELWDEIASVEAKLYSGLDDVKLDALAKVGLDSIAEAQLEFKMVTFLLLPEEAERVEALFDRGLELSKADTLYVARLAEFSRLIDALTKARAAHGVRNASVGLMAVLDIFERHLVDLSEGWEGDANRQGSVPIASVLGTDMVPVAVASLLKQAVDRLLSSGEIESDERWRVLERLLR